MGEFEILYCSWKTSIDLIRPRAHDDDDDDDGDDDGDGDDYDDGDGGDGGGDDGDDNYDDDYIYVMMKCHAPVFPQG